MDDNEEPFVITFDDEACEKRGPRVSFRRRYFSDAPAQFGDLLARHMLWDACPPALQRDLPRRSSRVIVIETDPDWLDYVHAAARGLFKPVSIITNDDLGKKTKLVRNIALQSAIASGQSLVVVSSQGLAGIDESIIASIDYHLKTGRPTDVQLTAALRTVFRTRRIKTVPPGVGADSAAGSLIAAVRLKDGATRALTRLVALDHRNKSKSSTNLAPGPILEDLTGFGAAQKWGLELAADIDAFRRGELEWAEISSAAILFGVPGTGKSYFSSALARSCNVPLIQTSLGRIFASRSGYLHDFVKGLDQVFLDARTQAPSILFIDEIDALPDRATLEGANLDWWTTVVNHVLKLLDEARHGVVVVGATNMIGRLDEALVRPGRLERHFEIALPGEADLQGIFRHHLGSRLPDSDLGPLARLALGSTGAQVALHVKSAVAAARRQQRDLEYEDLLREVAGEQLPEHDFRRICVHEAGHAIAAIALGRQVKYVSAHGAPDAHNPSTLVEGPGATPTRTHLEEQAMIALAGRAAEILLFGDASAGAHNDLKEATGFLSAIHGSLGLGSALVHRANMSEASKLLRDPQFADLIEAELRVLDARCTDILTGRMEQLRTVSETLRTKHVLTGQDLTRLIAA